MDGKLKKHITKILKALSLLKKRNYLSNVQETIGYSYSFLDFLYSGGKLDKRKMKILESCLGILKTDVFKGNEVIRNNIDEILSFLK